MLVEKNVHFKVRTKEDPTSSLSVDARQAEDALHPFRAFASIFSRQVFFVFRSILKAT